MLILPELIERQSKGRPNATALVYRGLAVTYAELQDRIERWAGVLHRLGVRPGDAFGIVMRNSPEFIITFFALARLGARAVPANFLLKAEEIAFIFEDAGVVGAITQPAFVNTVLAVRRQAARLKTVVLSGDRRLMPWPPPPGFDYASGGSVRPERRALPAGGEPDVLSYARLMESAANVPDLPRPAESDAPAMLIYTSGTTGRPKGAMLTHRNFIANVEQCMRMVPLRQRDVFLCLLPMFHSFAWTVCVLLPLYLGCAIVIVESIQPFGDVMRHIMRHRVSIFVAVPPIFAALLRVPFWRPLRFINPVRLCVSGAAPLPMSVHQRFEEKFGVPLLEGYGLTEASPVVTLNPARRRVPGSVGKALPDVELRIVGENGEDLRPGEVGEICVRGDNVMAGYYHQEAATREAFLDEERRWMKTGDLGFLDRDGYLFISDRKKDLIIVKGLNVYPKEVEDVLMSHPDVAEAAVIGVQDGTGDELIKAYVMLKEGASADRQVLLRLCRSRLAPYKCPRDLEIRPDLPKNTLGKVLKRALRTEASPKRPVGS